MFKNILNKIKNINLKNSFTEKIVDKLRSILPYLLPENWSKNRKSYILFWLIGGFCISFITWASIANVNQVVKASGTVIPASKVHIVQSNINGSIEEINVALGDKVKLGDIIFKIDHANMKKLYDLSNAEVKTRSRKVEILSKLVQKGSDSEFRLLDEELALIDAEKRNDLTRKQFESSLVKASVNGSISKVSVTNLGQVVQPGNLLAEIVPENDKLKIEASVLPKDIAYVKVNQKAMIGFSAFDQSIYGRVEGVVTKVAANTSKTEDSVFYPIIIELNEDEIKKSTRIKLQSGLVTDVSIIGEERTVISYLLNPITKLSQTALQE
ncbi:HlyD family efflux transporter periplasmic adaptor subunit [Rhodobiaceae bacterium]|jgi:multidrug efflux pump subunit AcrA (membrane-fusion protein)|nr:HlyD family efflux transporter periplasmic adaptor subunit [Rhodobiaceae bacterium]|tara:strand:- start:1523 stop:2500 length:978 start_codon:yes stop_codon:yes gene_type:complete